MSYEAANGENLPLRFELMRPPVTEAEDALAGAPGLALPGSLMSAQDH
jgi:hypothetical protein